MSTPASMKGGPHTTNVLAKRRYLVIYIFLIFLSLYTAQFEFWFYWNLVSFYTQTLLFYILLPFWLFFMYVSFVIISLFYAKLFLIVINKIHPPTEGTFLRDISDKDYRYWSLRNVIKKWPFWLSHKFPLPFLDNLCFKVLGVQTKFSNSLFEGWVDNEFIEFGENVVVGQSSIVYSTLIMGNLLIIRKTVIEDNVRIGAHAIVMPGTHMGKNCILAANSMTTVGQELEDNWVYLGLPAKKYKKNRFYEDGLEDILDKYITDVNDIRERYEKLYTKRHDESLSFRDKFQRRMENIEKESERLKKGKKEELPKELKTGKKMSIKNVIKEEITLQFHWYLLSFFIIYYSAFVISGALVVWFHFTFYKFHFLDRLYLTEIIFNRESILISILFPLLLIGSYILHLICVALSTRWVWRLTEKVSPSKNGVIPRGIPSKTLNLYHVRSFIIKYGKKAFQKGAFSWLITCFYDVVGSDKIGKGTTLEEQFGCDRYVEIGENSYIGLHSAISSHVVEGIFGNLVYFKINIGDNVTTAGMNCIGPGTDINDNSYLLPLASSAKHSKFKGDNYYFGAPLRKIFTRKVKKYLDLTDEDLEKDEELKKQQ